MQTLTRQPSIGHLILTAMVKESWADEIRGDGFLNGLWTFKVHTIVWTAMVMRQSWVSSRYQGHSPKIFEISVRFRWIQIQDLRVRWRPGRRWGKRPSATRSNPVIFDWTNWQICYESSSFYIYILYVVCIVYTSMNYNELHVPSPSWPFKVLCGVAARHASGHDWT